MTHPTEPPDSPLYDATKPVACTIEAADVADHVTLIERIRDNLETIERTKHGVILRLPATNESAADLRQFAAEEKRCCEFWGFEVSQQADVTLRWDGPAETSSFMDGLIEYFHGRQPIGTLFGRL